MEMRELFPNLSLVVILLFGILKSNGAEPDRINRDQEIDEFQLRKACVITMLTYVGSNKIEFQKIRVISRLD